MTQNDDLKSVNGAKAGSFRDALKRADKNAKTEQSSSKDAAKSEKAPTKPSSAAKDQKTGSATEQKSGKRPANGKDPGRSTLAVRQAAARKTTGATTIDSDAHDGPASSHADSGGSAQDKQAPATVILPTPPTPAPSAGAPRITQAKPATTSDGAGSDEKEGTGTTKAVVRAVKPTSGKADASEADDVSTEGGADGATTSVSRDTPLAANKDFGSMVGAAAAVRASGSAVADSGSSDGAAASSGDAGDDASAVVTATATSGMDLLSDLASVDADPPDEAAKTGTTAAKPVALESATESPFAQALGAAGAKSAATERAAAPAADPTPDARFADVNHPKIVTGVRGELMPGGGTMHLRLDPPELGDLQISVHMRDGVMTAAFQTSNDQATRLLSHSLGNLKSMLEAQGVNVNKLHVQQGPKSNTSDTKDSRDNGTRDPSPEQRQSDRREQQRKEIVQKMWDKLAGKAPVDVVA